MRIIAGKYGGRFFHPPQKLPVRPTTEKAKESLFNILQNYFDLEDFLVLDLFSGTGNMAFEFASRGAKVLSIDKHWACVKFIQKTALEFQMKDLSAKKQDVFQFISQEKKQFDLIFADPPYFLNRVLELPNLIFQNKLLKKEAWFVLEHSINLDFENHPHFFQKRKYGQSVFSIFTN